MPPKAKITQEMILDTVLAITRESGFEAVNARSIADRLHCSTRPIFTCYTNMEALKKAFLTFSYQYYEEYVSEYKQNENISALLVLPLSYICFAREETNLFKLLFIQDMALQMHEAKDFYQEKDNETRAAEFSRFIGLAPEAGKRVFLDLFLYAHGVAVLAATKKLALSRDAMEPMIKNVLEALIRREKPDWNGLTEEIPAKPKEV